MANKSLNDDWLDGYGACLCVLAEAVDPKDVAPDPRKVAIVGYLMDRIEEDHTSNIKEMSRILAALDLELVSVWLSGCKYEELSAAKHAGLIISMPYARTAAQILARRTGAKLVEMGLPFGIEGTAEWIKKLANTVGRSANAKDFIDGELKHIVPRLEWVVPRLFLNKNFAFLGDSYLLEPFVRLIDELGGHVRIAAVMKKQKREPEKWAVPKNQRKIKVLVSPSAHQLPLALKKVMEQHPLDLIITNSIFRKFCDLKDAPYLEFGFPSFFSYALLDSPFLGFRGCMNFVNQMANQLCFLRRMKVCQY